MDDLIRIYNKALSTEYCDYLIDKFEKNLEQQERVGGHRRSFVHLDMLDKDNWSEDIKGYGTQLWEFGEEDSDFDIEEQFK